MREIYFRGRSSEDKKTWYHGHFYIEAGNMPNPIRTPKSPPPDPGKAFIVFPGFADWNMPREMQRVQVDPETVGQYVGRKDIKGKKLYEDDIVSNGDHTFKISFDHTAFVLNYLELDVKGKFVILRDRIDDWPLEVVGNIHDNPEMMEVNHDDKNKG